MNILITGCAGFIGFHLTLKLLNNKKYTLIGIDDLNSYYDINLKKDRLKILKKKNKDFKFYKINISKRSLLNNIFKKYNIDIVLHLAAQAGVRYSINNPKIYMDSNIIGFFNILDLSNNYNIKHLYFASSSSVFGNNLNFPWNENTNSDNPLSFYAASKKSNEVFAYAYSKIYKLKCTALRFFTVYGEWGRPDMALFKFMDSIVKNKTISLYNNGENIRDFTNIHDVTNIIVKLLNKKNKQKSNFEVYNISSNKPIRVTKLLKLIEKHAGLKSKTRLVGYQKGDAIKTYSKNAKITRKVNYKFEKNIDIGVKEFVNWYLKYYNLNIK